MGIVVVGLSHKTAPVEVREKLSFCEPALPDALLKLSRYEGITECLILSTCNRVEICASVKDSAKGVEQIKRYISEYHHIPPAALDQSLYVHTNGEAVRHIFRVASSLDSMVVGEPQILGQLKDAFDSALKTKTTSVVLNKLLQKAISVAKRVRTETRIAESTLSISVAAVELARKIFGELAGKTVMLLGSGEMAELAARSFQQNEVKSILVANRTFSRAVELANEFHGSAVRFEDFPSEMVMADILLCSTGAPTYVVGPDIVSRVLKARRNNPIFMIDISVPRNIDPAVNELDNVFLYDIDDLQGVVSSNLEGRAREAEKAEELVMQEVATYLQWESALDAVPMIVELREKMDGIRQRELDKTLAQLSDLTEEQRKVVETMSLSLVNKIMHAPIVVLKQTAADPEGSGFLAFARKVFNLDKELQKQRNEKGAGACGKDDSEKS